MQTHEITTYRFGELSLEAQEKALDANRYWNVEGGTEWWDSTHEDVKEIGKILGIEIDKIWFSGFCSKGDGACFEGRYEYVKGSAKKIREYAPKDEELHGIADVLAKLQRPYFYGLYADVKHRGHYMHENCTDIEVREDEYEHEIPADDVAETLRDFMRWIYRSLEKQHEYLTSDDCVKETLIANETEFLESGERF